MLCISVEDFLTKASSAKKLTRQGHENSFCFHG